MNISHRDFRMNEWLLLLFYYIGRVFRPYHPLDNILFVSIAGSFIFMNCCASLASILVYICNVLPLHFHRSVSFSYIEFSDHFIRMKNEKKYPTLYQYLVSFLSNLVGWTLGPVLLLNAVFIENWIFWKKKKSCSSAWCVPMCVVCVGVWLCLCFFESNFSFNQNVKSNCFYLRNFN